MSGCGRGKIWSCHRDNIVGHNKVFLSCLNFFQEPKKELKNLLFFLLRREKNPAAQKYIPTSQKFVLNHFSAAGINVEKYTHV